MRRHAAGRAPRWIPFLALPGCGPAGKGRVTALVISDHVCGNSRMARRPVSDRWVSRDPGGGRADGGIAVTGDTRGQRCQARSCTSRSRRTTPAGAGSSGAPCPDGSSRRTPARSSTTRRRLAGSRARRRGCRRPPRTGRTVRSRRSATRPPHQAGPVRSRHEGLLRPALRTGPSCFSGRGVLRSRPLVTGDCAAASHRARPLPICSAGGSRDPGEVVAAGLVTLVPAARDLRLRNRPAAALT